MSNRKHSATSKESWDSVKDHLSGMHQKIMDGLSKLPVGGNSYEIAISANLEKEQVHKRLSGLQEMGLIFNTGITRLSPKGKKCTVYQIRPQTTNQSFTQPELFQS